MTFTPQFLTPAAVKMDRFFYETTIKERPMGLLSTAFWPLKKILTRVANGKTMAVGGINMAVFARPEGKKVTFLKKLPDPSDKSGCKYPALVKEFLETLLGEVRDQYWSDPTAGNEVKTKEFLDLFGQKVLFRELLINYFAMLLEGGETKTTHEAAWKAAVNEVDSQEFQLSYSIFVDE